MPYPTDYAPFVVPSGHTITDDPGGTQVDAFHANALRDDAVAYIEDHIQNLSSANQHSTSNIFEVSQQSGFESTAYAQTALTAYSQFQMNSMFRQLFRQIIGGTTNSQTLTQMMTTWLARSDAANVNLFHFADLLAGATSLAISNTIPLRDPTTGQILLNALGLSIPVGSTLPAALTYRRVASQTLPFMVALDEVGVLLAQMGADGSLRGTRGAFYGNNAAAALLYGVASASPSVDVFQFIDSTQTTPWFRATSGFNIVAKNGYWVGAVGAEKQIIDAAGNIIGVGGGAVTATGTTMVLTASPFTMVSSAGVPVSSAGGTTTPTAPPTAGWSWVVAVYADDAGAVQHINGAQAASSPAPPTLPEYARLLAVTTVANGQTAITQAQVTDRRNFLAPYNSPFTQLSPVGFGAAASTVAQVAIGGTMVGTSSAIGLNIASTVQPQAGQGAFSVNIFPTVDTTNGTLGNAFGIRIVALTKTGAGSIPAAYGIYVAAPTGGTVNKIVMFDGSAITNGQIVQVDKTGHLALSSGAAPTTSGLLTNVTSATLAGTDQVAKLTVVTSSTVATASTVCTVTFATAMDAAPNGVMLVPADSATWALAGTAQLTTAGITATNFLVKSGSTSPAAGTYTYTVVAI